MFNKINVIEVVEVIGLLYIYDEIKNFIIFVKC